MDQKLHISGWFCVCLHVPSYQDAITPDVLLPLTVIILTELQQYPWHASKHNEVYFPASSKWGKCHREKYEQKSETNSFGTIKLRDQGCPCCESALGLPEVDWWFRNRNKKQRNV